MEAIRACDIMTEHVITVKSTCNLRVLTHLFLRYRISGVPVINSRGKIAGVMTMNDLMEAVYMRMDGDEYGVPEIFRELESQQVRKFMKKDYLSVSPETPILDVFKMAKQAQIMTVPVVSKGKLVGVLGLRDILNIGMSEA